MKLPGCAKGNPGHWGKRGQGVQSFLAGEGLAALQLPSSEAVAQMDLGYHFILQCTSSRNPGNPEKALFTIYKPQKTCINTSFACVKCSKPGPKYKQDIGILSLFSTTFKTQYLIINGCWSLSTVDLVCFPQRLEVCRVTFRFGT